MPHQCKPCPYYAHIPHPSGHALLSPTHISIKSRPIPTKPSLPGGDAALQLGPGPIPPHVDMPPAPRRMVRTPGNTSITLCSFSSPSPPTVSPAIPHLFEHHYIATVLIISKGERCQAGHLCHVMPGGTRNCWHWGSSVFPSGVPLLPMRVPNCPRGAAILGCSRPIPMSPVSNPSIRSTAPQWHHCTRPVPSILSSALSTTSVPSAHPGPHSQDAPLYFVHGLEPAPGLPSGLDELGYLLLHLGTHGQARQAQEFVGARGECHCPKMPSAACPPTHPFSELDLLALVLLLQLLHASSLFWRGQGGSGRW